VRESVVFEEVAEAASPSGQEELPGEDPETSPDHR
jgi:hypothetical protein